MTWGALFMCYECPRCGRKFRFALDTMEEMGENFGKCPNCHVDGKYMTEGPVSKEIQKFEEVE